MRKYTSGATCAAGVALASRNDVLWVAFPGGGGLGGGPPNHKLNIMPVQPGAPNDSWSFDRLLVLEQETSMEQPALASFGGKLWLAWTGADSVHRLNLMSLAVDSNNHATAETNSKLTFNWTATGGPRFVPSRPGYISPSVAAVALGEPNPTEPLTWLGQPTAATGHKVS